jgi:hypothetical protein
MLFHVKNGLLSHICVPLPTILMAFGWSLFTAGSSSFAARPLLLESCQARELVDLSLWNLEMARLLDLWLQMDAADQIPYPSMERDPYEDHSNNNQSEVVCTSQEGNDSN